jgi:hypothetical protein
VVKLSDYTLIVNVLLPSRIEIVEVSKAKGCILGDLECLEDNIGRGPGDVLLPDESDQ